MRKLDRYIAQSFLEPFLTATAAIVGLYLVADAFSNLDEYLREAESLGVAITRMAQIYLLRIPTFLAPVLPISMLVGASYGIAQLSGHNELTAMKASGVSLWRILTPIYIVAVAAALLGLANRELLVPRIERHVSANLSKWTGEKDRYSRVTIYHQPEETLFTLTYDVVERRALSMSIIRKNSGEQIRAREAVPIRRGWKLIDVQRGSDLIPEFELKTSLRARDVELALLDERLCPITTLGELIRQEDDASTKRRYRLRYHERLAYPFTGIVLVGLGLPFVIAHERAQRSRLLGVGACVLICMFFYTIQFIANDLGQTGHLPPQLAAWLPTIIFGAFGLYMLENVHS